MNIIQLYEEKENQDCFEFLENKIREASQQMIERIYSEEVLDFLNRTVFIIFCFFIKIIFLKIAYLKSSFSI